MSRYGAGFNHVETYQVPEPASQLNQTGHTINLLQTPGVFNNLEESSIGWRRLKEKGIYGILKRPDVLKTTFYI